jgi:hypothetical protein
MACDVYEGALRSPSRRGVWLRKRRRPMASYAVGGVASLEARALAVASIAQTKFAPPAALNHEIRY